MTCELSLKKVTQPNGLWVIGDQGCSYCPLLHFISKANQMKNQWCPKKWTQQKKDTSFPSRGEQFSLEFVVDFHHYTKILSLSIPWKWVKRFLEKCFFCLQTWYERFGMCQWKTQKREQCLVWTMFIQLSREKDRIYQSMLWRKQ